MTLLTRRDLLWIFPVSLVFGALLSFLQGGSWLPGWLGFTFLFALSISVLTLATRWAGGGRILVWMVSLAFVLRLATGVAAFFLLPIDGHADEVNRAGFVFQDAYLRDKQAWALASSDLPISDAFNQTYAHDQYGGLLAFSALVYRSLSPDSYRPLLLVLMTAFVAAAALPVLWMAVARQWGAQMALVSGWVFALYPESVLLGGSAMREPYLMTFSALCLWGFVSWLGARKPAKSAKSARANTSGRSLIWLGLGIAGMLLVSPSVALITLILLGGWLYFSGEHGRIPWWALAGMAVIFVVGLFLLAEALDPRGEFSAATPLGVVINWLRAAIRWDVYQLVDESGWVQKLFDEMPQWLRLPFVAGYGILQPVLPAAIAAPSTTTWKVITILRAVGWYALLPLLIFSFFAAAGAAAKERKIWYWIAAVCWFWIVLAALRGGGDQWDNPRYRAILFLWQAVLAGRAYLYWLEKRPLAFWQIIAGEVVFLVVFTQWYASRYFSLGGRLEFGPMVALILGSWTLILAAGWILPAARRLLRRA